MTVNRARRLVKQLRRSEANPDPVRYARAVVVSSQTGQTVVSLDGGATTVPAFNFAHTQSLPAGSVVRVIVRGDQLEVLGSYSGTVSVTTPAPPVPPPTPSPPPPPTGTTHIPAAPLGPARPTAGYRLVFADDFVGTSLDTTRWNPTSSNGNAASTGLSSGFQTYEIQIYDSNQVSVSGSNLVLTCIPKVEGGKNFASGVAEGGTVSNPFLFSPTHAGTVFIEARIKIPGSATGSAGTIFPAFWAVTFRQFGASTNPPGGFYTREMDFFEFGTNELTNPGGAGPYGQPNYIDSVQLYPSGGYGSGTNIINNGSVFNAILGQDMSQAFHIYTVKINTDGSFTLWIDGSHQWDMPAHTATDWMGIIFNYAIYEVPGGGFTSDTMLVDYVAAWQDAGVTVGSGILNPGLAAGTTAP